MITFSRVCAKVWKLVDFFDPIVMREMQRSEFEQLDREILDWYDSVPEEIKIDELTTQIPIPGTSTYDTDRLQIWTRLRRNQVRLARVENDRSLIRVTDSHLAVHSYPPLVTQHREKP